MKQLPSVLGLALASFTPALAETVQVDVTGIVESNQIASGELGTVNADDAVSMTFEVDSRVFTNSGSFGTRGYPIDPASFSMTLGSAEVDLQFPFPGTPYFVLRDDDPGVDGFFVATSVDFPIGVPLDVVGGFGNFVDNYSVTYGGATLSSLDILGAVGLYDFGGLTVFNWTIDDGPFNPLLITFQQMSISRGSAAVPTLPEWGMLLLTVLLLGAGATVLARRTRALRA